MKIVLSGVETNNKGAELMLYAILQEIERKWSNADVFIPYSQIKQGLGYIKTSLKLKYTNPFVHMFHLKGLIKSMHLPQSWLFPTEIVKGTDWFLDASGFAITDQWNIKADRVKKWEIILKSLHRQGSRIVFLPQAFGPFEKDNTKRILKLVNDNASIIMPRDMISYKHIDESGIVDMKKVSLYTDFTSLVEGVFPSAYEHLKNGVCVIPNMRMIDKGTISYNNYLKLLSSIIEISRKGSRPVYLLNHEGNKDELLAYKCKEEIGNDIEVVTGLNALEVKGLIASAYLVITSRFHGLASALNSSVPCLATSWSHKYKELYKDYQLSDCILPLDDLLAAMNMVISFLDESKNQELRTYLTNQLPRIHAQSISMWNEIWNLK